MVERHLLRKGSNLLQLHVFVEDALQLAVLLHDDLEELVDGLLLHFWFFEGKGQDAG